MSSVRSGQGFRPPEQLNAGSFPKSDLGSAVVCRLGGGSSNSLQQRRGGALGFDRVYSHPLHLAVLSAVLLTLAGGLEAQQSAAPRLADYVGTYADAPGHTLEIVDGDGLFAVVDEAKYPLRPSGGDRFTTITGQIILFLRDATGKVTGYEQNGTLHPRVSANITPEAAALARPRPPGQDSPADYRYQPPADLHDGIAVGDIAQSDLGVATANAIVRAILDGTYRDVHSVLLYQRGKLVMEEYLYGYSIERPHQLRSATKSLVSALAGIAIDRGALTGVNEQVLPLMAYARYDHPDPHKAAITIGDFLSMSSGLDCNDHSSTSPGRETVIDNQPDWVKATLDLPMINDPAPGRTTARAASLLSAAPSRTRFMHGCRTTLRKISFSRWEFRAPPGPGITT